MRKRVGGEPEPEEVTNVEEEGVGEEGAEEYQELEEIMGDNMEVEDEQSVDSSSEDENQIIKKLYKKKKKVITQKTKVEPKTVKKQEQKKAKSTFGTPSPIKIVKKKKGYKNSLNSRFKNLDSPPIKKAFPNDISTPIQNK